MKKLIITIVVGLGLIACGGSPAPPDEEVSATWTSGDDAPLETPEDEAE